MGTEIRTKVSEESYAYLKALEVATENTIDSTILRKLSLAYGLKYYSTNNAREINNKRVKEIRSGSFVNPIFEALIRQKNGISNIDKKGYYEDYIEYGAKLLYEKLEESKTRQNFLLELIKTEVMNQTFNTSTYTTKNYISKNSLDNNAINVNLGIGEDDDINICFNSLSNSGYHMGIVGTTGSGKTQLALKIASQVAKQSPNTNIIFLDYAKGDVATNEKFIKAINAEVINAIDDGVPFNPFYISSIDDIKIEELKELIVSNQPKIGPNQKLELFNIIKNTYDKHDIVNFEVIYEELKEYYKEQNKELNVLVELFHKITISNIFRMTSTKTKINSFLKPNLVIDLHNIESTMSIKEITTFFVLHKIYTEAINLPDSEINKETGIREIRTMILLDEGHNYLNAKNPILEKMLRELRSKGISVVIISQSYSDFNTKDFNYSEMMNWIIVMKSHVTSKDIQQALSVSSEVSKNLQLEIAELSPLAFYVRGIKSNLDSSYPMLIHSNSYN